MLRRAAAICLRVAIVVASYRYFRFDFFFLKYVPTRIVWPLRVMV
jgi:hypothetical protein